MHVHHLPEEKKKYEFILNNKRTTFYKISCTDLSSDANKEKMKFLENILKTLFQFVFTRLHNQVKQTPAIYLKFF